MGMIYKLSVRATDYCIMKKWVDPSVRDWSIYAIERKLLSLTFFILLSLLAVIIGRPLEITTFALVFYFLRRRMGGWHAKHVFSCQTLSVMIVLGAVLIIGPALQELPMLIVSFVDFVVMFLALGIRPCYPAQVNFSGKEKQACAKRKNQIVLWLVFVQLLSLMLSWKNMLVYSTLGVLAGIISVYIEWICQKSRKDE